MRRGFRKREKTEDRMKTKSGNTYNVETVRKLFSAIYMMHVEDNAIATT